MSYTEFIKTNIESICIENPIDEVHHCPKCHHSFITKKPDLFLVDKLTKFVTEQLNPVRLFIEMMKESTNAK